MREIVKARSGGPYETVRSCSRALAAGDVILACDITGRDEKTHAIAPDARGEARQCIGVDQG